MIRRPPRSTRTDTLFPTRRSSDLSWIGRAVDTPRLDLCANLHYDGTNWRLKRTASGAAALILEGNALNGALDFYRVAGGTAGATASLSSHLAIGSDGRLPGSYNVFNQIG